MIEVESGLLNGNVGWRSGHTAMIRTRLVESIRITFDLGAVPELSLPASIIALRSGESPGFIRQTAWEDCAIEIIRAAILQLVAMGFLNVIRASIGRFFLFMKFRTETAYLLSARADRDASCDGRLEERILRTVALEHCREISGAKLPGALIEKVVWSLIGSFQPFPATVLVYSVQLDAEKKGWGTSHGLVFPRFDPASHRLKELEREQQKSSALLEKFSSINPEFIRAVTTQIRKGIRSRTTISGWEYM